VPLAIFLTETNAPMILGTAYRSVALLPVVLKVWRSLLSGDAASADCVRTLVELDSAAEDRSAQRSIAMQWIKALPEVLRLCDKLPGHTEAICGYIKALPTLMQITRNLPEGESPFVHRFQDVSLRSVIREEYLTAASKGRSVLHFGFLDAPFSEERLQSGELLHLKLKEVASHLYGIDSDRASLDRYRQLTGDGNNAVMDIQMGLGEEIEGQAFDLILLPEILEHLGSPLLALGHLRRLCEKNRETTLCVTVPNAYYAGVFLRALEGDEIVHPGHYYYFSPATLRKILTDAGFAIVDLALYGSRDSSALPGITKNGVIALCRAS
jgi:hypothetical protein